MARPTAGAKSVPTRQEWDQWVQSRALLEHEHAVIEFGARYGTTSCVLAELMALLWIVTWTPYAIVAMIGVFGNQMLITPLVAQLPSFLGIKELFAELQMLIIRGAGKGRGRKAG